MVGITDVVLLSSSNIHQKKRTERALPVIQVFHGDRPAIGQDEKIMLSRVTNALTAIVRVDRSFPSVLKVLLIYSGALELQCEASVSKFRVKNIVDEMIPSPYTHEQLTSSYIRYVRIGRLIPESSEVLPMLESLNNLRNIGKVLRML